MSLKPALSPIDQNEKNSGEVSSYLNILKGFSFFGSVQIINILVNIVRGKFVAVLLGPFGMGVSSLFNNVSTSIQQLSSFGLSMAIVRDVADESSGSFDKSNIISVSVLLSWSSALLGFILTAIFSVPLSVLTFGSGEYAWQFVLLGIGIFFGIAGSGKLAILQGLHEVKRISKASIVGALTGLFLGVPLYYLFHDKGIVPAIVVIFLSLYVFYSISLSKSAKYAIDYYNLKTHLPLVKKLLGLGIILMSGELIASLVTYLINLFIRYFGTVDQVGLYQAAHTIAFQFAGIIFTTLAMDYYPRLSKVSTDNKLLCKVVNRQSEIVSWLITPAMCLLILSTPLLIELLLAESFHEITPLMRWMGIGLFMRAYAYPMAYITFAKGNKKVFFILEGICANLLTLTISCFCYYFFGLIGLGFAITIDNTLCFLLYFLVNKRLYGFTFSLKAIKSYLTGTILIGTCFISSLIDTPSISYILMSLSCVISIFWAILNIKQIYTR